MRLKIRSRSSGGMPGPSSVTEIRREVRSAEGAADRVIFVPAGAYFAALPSRLSRIRISFPGSAKRVAWRSCDTDKQKISPLILCNIWQQDHGCRCCHQKRSCSAPLYPVRITEQGHIIQILLFLSQYIKQHEYRCQPCHTPKCPKAPCSSHK